MVVLKFKSDELAFSDANKFSDADRKDILNRKYQVVVGDLKLSVEGVVFYMKQDDVFLYGYNKPAGKFFKKDMMKDLVFYEEGSFKCVPDKVKALLGQADFVSVEKEPVEVVSAPAPKPAEPEPKKVEAPSKKKKIKGG